MLLIERHFYFTVVCALFSSLRSFFTFTVLRDGLTSTYVMDSCTIF